MTITFNNPNFPYPLGQGFQLAVTSDLIGPIADDDYYVTTVRPHAGGDLLCYAIKRAHGAHVVGFVLNVTRDYPGLQPFSPSVGLAAGGSIDVECTLYHSNLFTVVDSSAVVNTTYDPFTGISALIQTSSSSPDLSSVLNAVIRTFPAP